MEKFQYDNQIIEYILERKKIKNCYISIKDGVVTLRVPRRFSQKSIDELLQKRLKWILKNVKEQQNKVKLPKQFVEGEKFRVLGEVFELQISYENRKNTKLKLSRGKININLPFQYKENFKEQVKKILSDFYAELAEKEIKKAMQKMILKTGLIPNKYTIKNLKSTWGNCSTTRNISINKNIVMYSRHVIEYVCLHELCHLKYMNHSKKFWNLVENYMPDYKKAEEELKK